MFNLTIVKTRDDVYICAHAQWISYVFHRKLKVAYFPCKHQGKYIANVNILIGDKIRTLFHYKHIRF